MLSRALLIARKDLWLRFTNGTSLLFLLALPLGISLIITVVFGTPGGATDAVSLQDIPVGILNLDTGASLQGQTVNHGAGLVQLLGEADEAVVTDASAAQCPWADEPTGTVSAGLARLFAVRAVTDAPSGRALVDTGELAALIVIPPDFSARLSPRVGPGAAPLYPEAPVPIEVYSGPGRSLEALVARSVVAGYSGQLQTGNIAFGASLNALIAQQPFVALRLTGGTRDAQVAAAFACGFADLAAGADPDLRQLAADADSSDMPLRPATAVLAFIGTAQATFFALFAAQFGALGVIEERQAGTLQRILTTVTTRNAFIAGKLLGTWVSALVQILLLLLALSLFASLLESRLLFLWGSNLLALAALLLPLALAVAGLGMLLVSFAQRPEPLGALGALVNIVLAMLGGAFGFTVPEPWSWFSLVHWGVTGLSRLSAGSGDIGLPALMLTVQGMALFGIGLWLFRRRVEV